MEPPILWHVVDLSDAFCVTECETERAVTYGGDIRIGDLRNSGQADFLVYRSIDNAGSERVPHGQEVRVGCFKSGDSSPQMVVRCNGHSTEVLVVDVDGAVLRELDLNPSPNHTGMEVVYWGGKGAPALLYNGGMLWDPVQGTGSPLPSLPPPEAVGRMA